MIKQRHGRLCVQLCDAETPSRYFARGLAPLAEVEIVQPALLPFFLNELERSQRLAAGYLNKLRRRMEKVADTIGFLCAWSITGYRDLLARLQTVSPKERGFVEAHLCRFDRALFWRLGAEIHQMAVDPVHESCFLAGPGRAVKDSQGLKGIRFTQTVRWDFS